MNKPVAAVFAACAALMLTACGQSDSAKDGVQADNVEMPAEEAVGDIDATPAADATGAEAAETPTASATPTASETARK